MKKSLIAVLLLFLTNFQTSCFANGGGGCDFEIAALAQSESLGVNRMDDSQDFFSLSTITKVGENLVTSRQFLAALLNYLNGLSPSDVVLVVDGDHTVFAGDCTAIQNAFNSFNKKFVISAARCHPSVDDVKHFPAGDAVFSYLNGGAFMGVVSECRKIISRLYNLSFEHPTFTINQLFNLDYSKHKKDYKLDRKARLFLDTAGISPGNGDVTIQNTSPYVTTHLQDAENSNPLVIHSEGNGGGGDEVVQQIFEATGA